MYHRLAEIAEQYFDKGTKLYIEGKLRTHQWQDKQGISRTTTVIVVETFKFLSKKPESGQSNTQSYASASGVRTTTNNKV